jgi:hypothetical protein
MIRNERIRLFATALNNIGIGVGSVVVGIFAPIITGAAGGPLHFGAWLATGLLFLGLAQFTIGRLS